MNIRGIKLRNSLAAIIVGSLLLPIGSAAQGGSIQLAVDTADFEQDGLLVLFGGLRFQGEVGLPVAAGDINGDGRADVMFCGMYGSAGGINNGVVNFYMSDGSDSGFFNAALNPPNLFKLRGANSGDLLGTSISANGDVNGDGIRDVAIGAAGQDGPGNGLGDNRGAAYIVLGSTGFNLNETLNVSGPPPPGITVIYGPQARGRMGIWIDEGDVDGDGLADIVIGSDQINGLAGEHVGGAYIVFGSDSLPSVIDLANPPANVRTARIVGDNLEDHFGAALQVGDLNGDSIGDVIIGGSIFRDSASYVTPNYQDSGHDARGADFDGQRSNCGEAYVIYGQANWPSEVLLSTPPANATRVIGANPGDFLGSQLHAGDVNGDGRPDLIVGALQALAPDNRGKTGAVYVIYGDPRLPGATIDLAAPEASGLRVSTIYGEHHLDCAGDSVRVYDINNDGMSDLFIGSPERTFSVNGEQRDDAGVTELIFGQPDFLPSVIKLYEPPVSPSIFRLAGARGGDEFSYRLTGGDVDGDGYIDYIANAMHGDGFNNLTVNGGNVYVFSGRKLSEKLGKLPPEPEPAPTLTSATLNLNGAPVQQAPAGQSGLSIVVEGLGFTASLEIQINGAVVVSRTLPGSPAGSPPVLVLLDENPSIRNSAGALRVRVRNTNPPSGLSNEIVAGQLAGPQITAIRFKRKSSGMLVLKIDGTNFPSSGSVQVVANGLPVPLKSTGFKSSTFVQAKIKASVAPASGVVLNVRISTQAGTLSNEFAVVVP